jgi:hypothetical protein
LPYEPRVNIDEACHHDNGKLHRTWCFDTAGYSLFKIDSSRGSGVPETMLTKAFAGIIGADYWGAYRKYARLFDVQVQYCMVCAGANRHVRKETERFRAFSYEELTGRDKASLDIFWLKDESLEDTQTLPEPDVIAAEIVENLGAALALFGAIEEELGV